MSLPARQIGNSAEADLIYRILKLLNSKNFNSSTTEFKVVENYSALPPVETVSGEFFWVENSEGTQWLPGSMGGTYYPKGVYYSNGVTYVHTETPYQANQTEVNSGVNDNKFVSPLTLKNYSKWLEKFNVPTGNTNQYLDGTGTPKDFLPVSGGITRNIFLISSNTVGGESELIDYVYLSTGTFTYTQPSAIGNNNRYTIKNSGTGIITIIFTLGQNADESTSITLNPGVALDFISNNNNWNII